ncbi:hypothetical protein [Clostridium ihumii]|uniref:hypothetical protein n=1 Tax=Clostridium ihumii TaxID=1470356 RepID=UPI003D357F8B
MKSEEINLKTYDENEIEYDTEGRMKYNPIYHSNHGKSWSYDDNKYLIEWYEKIGAEEMSFALERTIATIMGRVNILRKQGLISKERIYKKRIRSLD